MEADAQEHSRMLPIQSLGQGDGPARTIQHERQRCTFQGATRETQKSGCLIGDEIPFAQVPIDSYGGSQSARYQQDFKKSIQQLGRLLGFWPLLMALEKGPRGQCLGPSRRQGTI